MKKGEIVLVILVVLFVVGLLLGYSITGEIVKDKRKIATYYGGGSYGMGVYGGSQVTTSVILTTTVVNKPIIQ